MNDNKISVFVIEVGFKNKYLIDITTCYGVISG